jgi:hypothetical protein
MCLGCLLVSSDSWHRVQAQEPADDQFRQARWRGAGVGTEFNIRLVRGEKRGKTSAELAHIETFARLETSGHWQYDLGLEAACTGAFDGSELPRGASGDGGGVCGRLSLRWKPCGAGPCDPIS